MQRITITMDDELLAAVDHLMARRGYSSRSEAKCDIIRDIAGRERLAEPGATCIGALTYVFDIAVRDLPRRPTNAHNDRHDLSIASLRIHLNHENCLEISVLRGPLEDVEAFADMVGSQRGVRHTDLHLIPAHIATVEHVHGDGANGT
jgi:CopG family transcriptional regulator, nickel-responsive regulator